MWMEQTAIKSGIGSKRSEALKYVDFLVFSFYEIRNQITKQAATNKIMHEFNQQSNDERYEKNKKKNKNANRLIANEAQIPQTWHDKQTTCCELLYSALYKWEQKNKNEYKTISTHNSAIKILLMVVEHYYKPGVQDKNHTQNKEVAYVVPASDSVKGKASLGTSEAYNSYGKVSEKYYKELVPYKHQGSTENCWYYSSLMMIDYWYGREARKLIIAAAPQTIRKKESGITRAKYSAQKGRYYRSKEQAAHAGLSNNRDTDILKELGLTKVYSPMREFTHLDLKDVSKLLQQYGPLMFSGPFAADKATGERFKVDHHVGKDSGHAIVVFGVSKDSVYIHDPANFFAFYKPKGRKVTWTIFRRAWGNKREIDKADRNNTNSDKTNSDETQDKFEMSILALTHHPQAPFKPALPFTRSFLSKATSVAVEQEKEKPTRVTEQEQEKEKPSTVTEHAQEIEKPTTTNDKEKVGP